VIEAALSRELVNEVVTGNNHTTWILLPPSLHCMGDGTILKVERGPDLNSRPEVWERFLNKGSQN